jgi:hypothetical protein
MHIITIEEFKICRLGGSLKTLRTDLTQTHFRKYVKIIKIDWLGVWSK